MMANPPNDVTDALVATFLKCECLNNNITNMQTITFLFVVADFLFQGRITRKINCAYQQARKNTPTKRRQGP